MKHKKRNEEKIGFGGIEIGGRVIYSSWFDTDAATFYDDFGLRHGYFRSRVKQKQKRG